MSESGSFGGRFCRNRTEPKGAATLNLQQQSRAWQRKLVIGDSRARGEMARAWDEVIGKLDDEMYRLAVAASDNGYSTAQLYQWGRFQRFQDVARGEVDRYVGMAGQTVGSQVDGAQSLALESADDMVRSAAGGQIVAGFPVSPNKTAVEFAYARTRGGSVARSFAGMTDQAIAQMSTRLVNGIALGQNPKVIARSMRTGLDIAKRRSLTFARTETLTAYREAHALTYGQNTDVIGGWIWVTAGDERVCPICEIMAGSKHPAGEPMQTHVNCRCVQGPLPMGKDARQLYGKTGGENIAAMSPGQRAERLGAGRAAAYEQGVPLSAMVASTSDPFWGKGRVLVPVRELGVLVA